MFSSSSLGQTPALVTHASCAGEVSILDSCLVALGYSRRSAANRTAASLVSVLENGNQLLGYVQTEANKQKINNKTSRCAAGVCDSLLAYVAILMLKITFCTELHMQVFQQTAPTQGSEPLLSCEPGQRAGAPKERGMTASLLGALQSWTHSVLPCCAGEAYAVPRHHVV